MYLDDGTIVLLFFLSKVLIAWYYASLFLLLSTYAIENDKTSEKTNTDINSVVLDEHTHTHM